MRESCATLLALGSPYRQWMVFAEQVVDASAGRIEIKSAYRLGGLTGQRDAAGCKVGHFSAFAERKADQACRYGVVAGLRGAAKVATSGTLNQLHRRSRVAVDLGR